MTRKEIGKAENNKLIVDYVQTYSLLTLKYNTGGGTKQHERHCVDLEKEMVKRGILTEEDVEHLNM